MAAALSQRGLIVRNGPADQNTAGTRRLYGQLTTAQYDPASTFASEVSLIANQSGSDALAFATLRGFERSGGDMAGEAARKMGIGMLTLGLYMPGPDLAGKASLIVTLVAGQRSVERQF